MERQSQEEIMDNLFKHFSNYHSDLICIFYNEVLGCLREKVVETDSLLNITQKGTSEYVDLLSKKINYTEVFEEWLSLPDTFSKSFIDTCLRG